MKQYTAALIGTGRIGFTLGFDKKREQPASHTMALLANKRIRLVAGCDSDAERLAAWQHYVQKKQHAAVAAFASSRELYAAMGVASAEDGAASTPSKATAAENAPSSCAASAPQKTLSVPDIITVAVNEDAHLAECIAALRARPRMVILEKPVALNSAEAAQIAACARENSVPVLVNHERRFAADYRAAHDYLGTIGDIQCIRADLFSGLRVYSAAEEATGAYSLLHDGTHLVDIVQYLIEALEQKPAAAQADNSVHGGAVQAQPTSASCNNSATQQTAVTAADNSAHGDAVHAQPLLRSPTLTGVYKDANGDVRNFSAHYSLPACPEITVSMSGRSRFFSFCVDVLGTTGRVVVGNGFAKFYRRTESNLYTGFYSLRRDKTVRLPRKTGYFANMVQNAVDFLDGAAPLKSPLSVATADLAVLEEIKAALQKA